MAPVHTGKSFVFKKITSSDRKRERVLFCYCCGKQGKRWQWAEKGRTHSAPVHTAKSLVFKKRINLNWKMRDVRVLLSDSVVGQTHSSPIHIQKIYYLRRCIDWGWEKGLWYCPGMQGWEWLWAETGSTQSITPFTPHRVLSPRIELATRKCIPKW